MIAMLNWSHRLAIVSCIHLIFIAGVALAISFILSNVQIMLVPNFLLPELEAKRLGRFGWNLAMASRATLDSSRALEKTYPWNPFVPSNRRKTSKMGITGQTLRLLQLSSKVTEFGLHRAHNFRVCMNLQCLSNMRNFACIAFYCENCDVSKIDCQNDLEQIWGLIK